MNNKLGIGLVAGAMGISLALGATGAIIGATKQGTNGKTAYEIAVEHGFTGSEAEWLASLKGATGDIGPQGNPGGTGAAGQDGVSIYQGYDNYIWNGSERTEYKVSTAYNEKSFENTIGVAGDMKNYFKHEYIDMSDNTVALMAHYMPTIGKTIYSGTTVTSLQVYAESAGTLHIGTASVADVVAARTTGATFTASTTSYNVVAGVNTITLELEVADTDTLVLGGSGSTAKLFVAKGVSVDDEAGNFAYIDGDTHTDLVCTTGEYADTLAISVEAGVYTPEYRVFNEDVTTLMTAENIATAVATGTAPYKVVSDNSAPFRYQANYFAGKTITKIGIPVQSVTSLDVNPFMTLTVVDKTQTKDFRTKNRRTIKLEIDKSTLNSTTVNNWVYVNCNIVLADDEELCFGALSGDTIDWTYKVDPHNTFKFYHNGGTANETLLFDVYAMEYDTYAEHLSNLQAAEDLAKNS